MTAFLAKQHRMLIDGKRVEARSGKTLLVEDPATEEIIAHVPAGDKEDIDLAVAAARRAINFSLWARIKPRDRSRLVWRLGDLLEKNADEFAELEVNRQRQARDQSEARRRRRTRCYVPVHGRMRTSKPRDRQRCKRDLLQPGPMLHQAAGARLHGPGSGNRRRQPLGATGATIGREDGWDGTCCAGWRKGSIESEVDGASREATLIFQLFAVL